MIEAYPLTWPVDFPRTKNPARSRFSNKLTVGVARENLLTELKLMRATNIIISSDVPIKKDVLLYANYKVKDTGIAVYFSYKNSPTVLCCDKWNTLQCNLHAIERTVNALRQLERDGVSDLLNRVFTGFKALPQNAGQGEASWWVALGLTSDATKEEVRKAYTTLSFQYHPDHNGGNSEMFLIIKKAYEIGMQAAK